VARRRGVGREKGDLRGGVVAQCKNCGCFLRSEIWNWHCVYPVHVLSGLGLIVQGLGFFWHSANLLPTPASSENVEC
jgi:hypothetical protein